MSSSIFVEPLFTRWNFDDIVIYTFKYERHMIEFVSYRDVDYSGKSKLFDNVYEAKIIKANIKFS